MNKIIDPVQPIFSKRRRNLKEQLLNIKDIDDLIVYTPYKNLKKTTNQRYVNAEDFIT